MLPVEKPLCLILDAGEVTNNKGGQIASSVSFSWKSATVPAVTNVMT